MSISEVWRSVPLEEFADFYEVSNLGRVRSLPKKGRAKAGGVRHFIGRLLRPSVGKRGYPSVYLRNAPKYRNIPVHRLVALAFIPNPDNLPEVNHIDLNKINNVASNLEWVSRVQNYIHAAENGALKTFLRKLSAADIVEIVRLHKRGLSQHRIAAQYGIRQSTVSRLVHGLRRKSG